MPGSRATAWFADAIRLWKRAPLVFSAMALVVLLASVVLEPVPIAGFVAANVLAPLLACGFLYGALAADRDERPRFLHLFAVFVAPVRAQLAIVATAIAVTLVESAVAWLIADVSLWSPMSSSTLSPSTIVILYAAGVFASLPLTFVPMAVLFDDERPGDAFSLSIRAFAHNLHPMGVFAAFTFGVLMAGLATMLIGLVMGLPWIYIASYAAWKDVFGLSDITRSDATRNP